MSVEIGLDRTARAERLTRGSVTGHSWFVKKLFDVDVYRADLKSD